MSFVEDIKFSCIIKNSNYIMRDHRVHGVRIMPGVTLIDMIYRMLKSKGIKPEDVELRKVWFNEPISTTNDYDKKIQIEFIKSADKNIIVAKSQKVKDGKKISDKWDTNLQCELHFAKVDKRNKIDIQSIKNNSHRCEDMDYAYSYVRKIDISHREFMKGNGKLYFCENKILAEVELSDLAQKSKENFYMHPAYLDCATLVQGFTVLQKADFEQDIKASIPIYIESFRSFGAMEDKIYVYISNEEDEDFVTKDIMYFNIEIFNENGEQIAVFKEWGLKKIRLKELVAENRVIISKEIDSRKGANAQRQDLRYVIKKKNESVKQYLVDLISKMLKVDMDNVNVEDGFYSQGLNSQDLLNVVTQLEKRLNCTLYPTLLFEYANISELSKYILEEHKAEFFTNTNMINTNVEEEFKPDSKIVFYSPYLEKAQKQSQKHKKYKNVLCLIERKEDRNKIINENLGDNCIFVIPSKEYSVKGDIYYIELSNMDHYCELIASLLERNMLPHLFIHSLGLNNHSFEEDIINRNLEVTLLSMYYITKTLLSVKIKESLKIVYVYKSHSDNGILESMNEAMHGYLNCLKSENSKISYRSLSIDTDNYNKVSKIIDVECSGSWNDDSRVYYLNKRRMIPQYKKIKFEPNKDKSKFKINGTYVIAGGTGGLGIKLSEYISDIGANVVILGRSSNCSKQLKNLISSRDNVEFMVCDITNLEAISDIKMIIKNNYESINGVINCAGITKDAYIINKEVEEIEAVVNVKIVGTINLDQAFMDERLDFFITFSSVAGILGNPGQSDYAYANMAMDHIVINREKLVNKGRRYGKSLSINWPLWSDGGMKGNKGIEETIDKKFGMQPLKTKEGFSALEYALQLDQTRLVIVVGDEDKLDVIFLRDKKEHGIGKPTIKKLSNEDNYPDDLVIVGLSGSYPMAENIFEYWNNLKEGKDCITEVDESRWDSNFYQSVTEKSWKKNCSRWGGFINDVSTFDALLFNIAPFQATLMDPHERKFLETSWETFEDGGYKKSDLKGEKVGVFVGVMWLHYQLYNNNANISTTTISSVANRVSYYFGLNGPSMGIDTMCSSSFTAMHLACQSIRNKDCKMALVGGINLSIHPHKYLLLSQGNFASEDGRCRSFGEGGSGYVPSEGRGAILIKTLKDAKKDGNRIYAVIKSSAINHGGEASGFTVPNQNAQKQVIVDAIEKSGIAVNTISYVEAHGTGTSLGDPIEVHALSKAYRQYTTDQQFCAIGSVKSNIGHAEAAAGMAAITKVLLQMKHKMLVPSIHSDKINSNIRIEGSPFYVQKKVELWKKPNVNINGVVSTYPRRAGLSAFGAGGSNSHIILEEYEENRKIKEEVKGEQHLFVISAQSKERISVYVELIYDFLKERSCNHSDKYREIENDLYTTLEKVTQLPKSEIGKNSNFNDLGLSTINLVAICDELNERYTIILTPVVFLIQDTVKKLAEYIKEKIGVIEINDCETMEFKLLSLLYTLQTGREPMKYRVAIVVTSLPDLMYKLELYMKHDENYDEDYDIYIGSSMKKKEFAMKCHADFGDKSQLAQDWVEGANVDWKQNYLSDEMIPISLPNYPFSKKKYWIEEPEELEVPVKVFKPKHEVYEGQEVVIDIIEKRIAIVTIQDIENNNTFTANVIEGLIHSFNEIQRNKDIKVIIVTGHDKIFSMGGTQAQLIDISNSKLSFTDAPFLYRGMLECEVPVISAMQGHASGGGMLFGLYADIVVMSEESIYSAVFTKYGFTPGMGATYILEEKLGKSIATEMMFTARSYTGKQLKNRNAGIIFRAKNDVLTEALQIAKSIADKPRNTICVLKKELSHRILDKLLICIKRENEMHKETFTTDEVKDRISHYYSPKSKLIKKIDKMEIEVKTEKVVKKNANISLKVIKENLTKILEKVILLEVEDIDEEMNFKDMGIDSISGVEIVRDINNQFRLDIDTVDIYDNFTIEALSKFILHEATGVLEQEESSSSKVDDGEEEILSMLAALDSESDLGEIARLLEAHYE